MKNKFVILFLLFNLLITHNIYAEEIINQNSVDIQAVETTQDSRYPDYSKMFVGEDKHEKFNRKMFNLNMKLNKFVAKPVHIIWSSIMPKFGIERIRDAYNNIEYPKRLVSCIIQRDGKAIKLETLRFLTNSTIGLGGLFDPADKILKVKPTNENMEQALCKCKMNSGSYFVMPCLHSCTPRSLCGRALEAALDPSVYIATPIASIVKFGLMLNRTSYLQPLVHLIETTYADPYDIHKKLFGIDNYIKNSNYDREELVQNMSGTNLEMEKEGVVTGGASNLSNLLPLTNPLKADIVLDGYKVQTPVIDSMKTALFEDESVDKSIWNEISLWNRSFSRRIKTGQVDVTEGREPYKFKYILQKDKTSPLVIIYPSIGEGAGAHHSMIFAKLFYNEGYSVVMQGSHFHWEFVKSMPVGYAPGLPQKDSELVREITLKILDNLKEKYNYEPTEKVVIGTSFGALASLFVAQKESSDNVLGVSKYIAISPPIELTYALEQIDKNGEECNRNSEEVKDKTALTAAKIIQLLDIKDSKKSNLEELPFTDEEGKLITTFILRQKLSDLIFTLENVPRNSEPKVYEMINNMSYRDYAEKYLGLSLNDSDILEKSSLYSLSEYFANNNNYKIYESFDDYLINREQIQKLKNIAGLHLTCLNCGSHLGFLYRKEFLEDLKNEMAILD